MNPPLDDVAVIMAHQHRVVALPDGAALLGSSAHCQNFLVEFIPRAIGIQGYPEFPVAFAAMFYKERRDRTGESVDQRWLHSTNRPMPVSSPIGSTTYWPRDVVAGPWRLSRQVWLVSRSRSSVRTG